VTELFDSHCHLTDAAFQEDLGAVFRRAREVGVTHVVSIASDVADARDALALVRGGSGEASGVRRWCTAGVHPHAAEAAAGDAMDQVRTLAVENPEVVALGETGLDYHYDNSPRQLQRHLFEAHLELGAELDLPVVVHAREADADVAALLRAMPPGTKGVLHCFVGGRELFEAGMEADWYVSFSGIVSFKSYGSADLLREVPEDRLLVETDAPYLAPVPMRGKRNEPAFVRHTVDALAGHLGVSAEHVAHRTTTNARRFYQLEG